MRQDETPQPVVAAGTDRTTGSPRRWLRTLDVGSMQQVALVAVCLLLGILMQIYFPRFLSGPNIEVTLTNFVTEGIMALGMTIVMITGGIDISVAATLQFSAIVVAMLLRAGVPVPAAIALTLLLAAMVGLLNASLINLFKVHPFIVTLATLLTLRGVDLVITGGTSISGLPDAFTTIGQDRLFGIRTSLLIFMVLALIIGYALRNHRYLQQAYFIGGNRRAARMSGIKVERFMLFAFVLNAVLAGIAGIIVCSQYGAASVSYGQNAELRVIAATAIGGTSFSGGSGTISGTVLGVLFLAMIYNAFNMSGINTYWQDVAIGVMLLAAVFLGEYLKRRRIARA
ncbi:MAG: ABC transporter permease [Caldilineaceae bacterium]|jgi:ribose transport system permease protein|nr:ABC transporter permease [Caldilineaceae bacterium]